MEEKGGKILFKELKHWEKKPYQSQASTSKKEKKIEQMVKLWLLFS